MEYVSQKKDYHTFITEVLENPDFDCGDLNLLANSNIEELRKREKEMVETYSAIGSSLQFVFISDFIQQNYKTQLLFYSFNHPTKYVLQEIACQLCRLLKWDESLIDTNTDTMSYNDRCLLYRSIQKYVDFNIDEHTPRLYQYESATSKEEIIKIYFQCLNDENQE
ncbi:hypothetical protein EBS02_10825 [bacterium]|nr:hypothetical protein [bacterium]